MTPSPSTWPALTGALVELSGPLAVEERAQLLATAAATVLCDGATVVILDPHGRVEAAGGSDDGCRHLAALDRPGSGGPTQACTRSGEVHTVPLDTGPLDTGPLDTGPLDTGPEWEASARAQGWGVAVAVPLLAGGTATGGLVLLGRPGWQLSTADLVWARTLAEVCAAGLLQVRGLAREYLVNRQLQRALDSRVVIEQAKGVLAERGGLDVSAAFDRMRRHARARRAPLAEVARGVVEGELADEVLTHVERPENRTDEAGPADGVR